MTNEEHKIELQVLKDNLYNHLAIYHERVTVLIQITLFEIEDTRVNFKAKILKPLNKSHAEENGLYHFMIVQDEISFSASYLFGQDENTSILNKNVLGRFYCPFTLWLDPELVRFVCDNQDEVTKQIPKYILNGEDWQDLIVKL